jgi:hydrogenase/urease accessory protein HupE
MSRPLRLLALLLGLSLGVGAQAHEVRPGYLELQQTGSETWDVLWKVPARGDLQLGIAPAWPGNCDVQGEPRRLATGAAATERSSIRCVGGLTGQEVAVSGLSATVIDVLVRLQRSDGTTQVARLTPSAPAFVVEEAPHWSAVATTYLGLGTEHILLGIDHLLFVLAMLLLVRSWRRLIATITAFTVAHSITLALATLGFVHVPPQPVEAAIALSIVFVAVEIVHSHMGRPGLTERWPWVVAFAFGLLHGLGFASALREVGLPENAIPTALLFFNVLDGRTYCGVLGVNPIHQLAADRSGPRLHLVDVIRANLATSQWRSHERKRTFPATYPARSAEAGLCHQEEDCDPFALMSAAPSGAFNLDHLRAGTEQTQHLRDLWPRCRLGERVGIAAMRRSERAMRRSAVGRSSEGSRSP